MSQYEFKRGDTFDLGGDATLLVDGQAVDFTGVTIAAWVAPSDKQGQPTGAKFAELSGAWLDIALGLYHVSKAKEDTVAWPVGYAVLDIEFTWPDGRRLTTPTLLFLIVPRVTHGE